MLQVGRDDVVAVGQDAFECHVQTIGAVEREDEALRPFAVEELIEQVPAVIQSALGGKRHLVPGAPRIGEIVAGEVIQRLVHRFRLGKTGGGVVEIDHELISILFPEPLPRQS